MSLLEIFTLGEVTRNAGLKKYNTASGSLTVLVRYISARFSHPNSIGYGCP